MLGLSALLPADHLAGLRGGVGSTFSREQCLRPTLLMTRERLPRMGIACRKSTLGVRGLALEAYVSCWSGFPLQGVHRFESLRLSDMSNRLFVAAIK
jgi:hypothetical protein